MPGEIRFFRARLDLPRFGAATHPVWRARRPVVRTLRPGATGVPECSYTARLAGIALAFESACMMPRHKEPGDAYYLRLPGFHPERTVFEENE
ncbi:MAG: hypothetical protein ACKVQQ_11415 [Burkholderiales bacterium]